VNPRMKPEQTLEFIKPEWKAPPRVKALCTTRYGGFSKSPYHSFNLALHVGDDDESVLRNRELLCDTLDILTEPCWLEQTHSTRVVNLEKDSNRLADAAITRQADTIAAVMTADCLPILLCNRAGTEVAAIHAGWRGLSDGVIEETVVDMQSPPEDLFAWIGPGISQQCFEVGDEVRDFFLSKNNSAEGRFIGNRPAHWLCDLSGLASDTLTRLEVTEIGGPKYCSYGDESLFFSYRRNAITGRMASLIWIDGKA
jgi:YfiH family protein